MKQIICLMLFLLFGTAANAATISNFDATYDTGLGEITYSFDVISVDGISTSGVNQFYFNYNPEISPFTGSTSIVSATSTGNSITYNTNDEFAIMFDTLTNSSAINYSITLDNIVTTELASFDVLQLYSNPTFLSGSLGGENSYSYSMQSHSSTSSAPVPEPATMLLFGLGLLGLAGVNRKKQ